MYSLTRLRYSFAVVRQLQPVHKFNLIFYLHNICLWNEHDNISWLLKLMACIFIINAHQNVSAMQIEDSKCNALLHLADLVDLLNTKYQQRIVNVWCLQWACIKRETRLRSKQKGAFLKMRCQSDHNCLRECIRSIFNPYWNHKMRLRCKTLTEMVNS